jgi:hypothetical protein
VIKIHAWRIFVWTFGALLVLHLVLEHVDIEQMVIRHALPMLLAACLVGLIPESGPHMIFVTLYAQGAIPFSILLASCIVQDGHGMIPMLAHSRRTFVQVKAIKFVIGLGVGLLLLGLGF